MGKPPEKRKPFPRWLLGLAVAGILPLAALILLGNGMMGVYQGMIEGNPRSPFHRWLQLATADACLSTWRPEMAAERYRRFVESNPEDERRRYALFRFAVALEDADKTSDAVAVYQRFAREYPEGDDANLARAGMDRLRHMKVR